MKGDPEGGSVCAPKYTKVPGGKKGGRQKKRVQMIKSEPFVYDLI
jgi:hypothetical protein